MNKKPRQKFKVFSVIPIFQNSLKIKLCDEDLTVKDLYGYLKIMQNYKFQVTMGEQKNFMRPFGLN